MTLEPLPSLIGEAYEVGYVPEKILANQYHSLKPEAVEFAR